MFGFNTQFSTNDFKRMYSCFYDFRNFGHSGAANGGIITAGIFEARDVIGSLNYVRIRKDLREMTIGLFSRCMGCNATMTHMVLLEKNRLQDFQSIRESWMKHTHLRNEASAA